MPTTIPATKKIIKHQVERATGLWQRPLFKDRLFIGFVALTFILSIISLALLAVKIRPRTFVVPLRYSTLQGFDSLGAWYRLFVYGFFSLIVTIGNTILAILSYPKSRITSFFLVLGTLIINAFTLVIIITLLSHVEL